MGSRDGQNMGCSTLQLLEQQKAVEEKRSYRDGYPCWVRRKEFAIGKVGRGVGTHCLPALPVALMGLGPQTLPGDEPKPQEPFLCLTQAVTTVCFVFVYMQVSGFLTDRMQSEGTLAADHFSQTTVLLSLLSPSEANP